MKGYNHSHIQFLILKNMIQFISHSIIIMGHFGNTKIVSWYCNSHLAHFSSGKVINLTSLTSLTAEVSRELSQ